MRGIHIHNMFQSGTDFWGGTWIRRTTPLREAWVLTPLMAFLTRAADHLGCEDAQCGTAGRRKLVVGRQGSVVDTAEHEGSVEHWGVQREEKTCVVVVVSNTFWSLVANGDCNLF
jgi:hypothetical protein